MSENGVSGCQIQVNLSDPNIFIPENTDQPSESPLPQRPETLLVGAAQNLLPQPQETPLPGLAQEPPQPYNVAQPPAALPRPVFLLLALRRRWLLSITLALTVGLVAALASWRYLPK